jgi:hypothetical protein
MRRGEKKMKKAAICIVLTLVIATIAVVPTSTATSTEEKPRIIQQLVNNGNPPEYWAETEKLTASDGGPLEFFGDSVAMDGDYAIVGVPSDDGNAEGSGSAYIFKRDGDSWIEEAKLLASDGAADDSFGHSVSIDGDYAIIGANWKGAYVGAAYIFKRDGSTWTEEAKLTASDGAAWEFFGWSVSISGDYAIVGAYCDDDNGKHAGSAYIFKRDGSSWTEEAKLLASDGEEYDYFGKAVAINGDYAFVGAPGCHVEIYGAAYIFKRDGSSWTEVEKLTPPIGETIGCYGSSVCMDGDYAAIGTDTYEIVYIYKLDGDSWIKEAELSVSDGTEFYVHHFGESVCIDGEHIIIGAIGDNDNGPLSGAAYIFKRNGISWTEVEKVIASDGKRKDWFGMSVSMDGDWAIVGAPWDNSHKGAAYVFKYTTHCPNKPSKPSGEINGKINVEYTYTTSTTDPDGDDVYYLFDWGDGTDSGWIGPYKSGDTASASHTWTKSLKINYNIKVKAKDTYGAKSLWSDPLTVTMPKSKTVNSIFLRSLQNSLNIFPAIRQLLGL